MLLTPTDPAGSAPRCWKQMPYFSGVIGFFRSLRGTLAAHPFNGVECHPGDASSDSDMPEVDEYA